MDFVRLRSKRAAAQVAALAVVALLLAASIAFAISAPIHIYGTGTDGVLLHSGPTVGSTRVGWMAEGTSPDYHCFTYGDNVNGVNVWFYVTKPGGGPTGYYASYYDDSSYQSEAELTSKYGIPKCGAAPPETPAGGDPAPTQPASTGSTPENPAPAAPAPTGNPPSLNAFYNRAAAVSWATAHAKDGQHYSDMCTWFVSHALWAGGFPKSSTWTDQGPYGSTTGTAAEWLVPNFLRYIRSQYSTVTTEITGALKTNAVPAAEPGDIIIYDWGAGAGQSHLALVHDIAPGSYPDVSEMGQWDVNPFRSKLQRVSPMYSRYVARGWTYSEVHHIWLQSERGHSRMRAWLLHINGGVDLPKF